jgi:hypothetical protein
LNSIHTNGKYDNKFDKRFRTHNKTFERSLETIEKFSPIDSKVGNEISEHLIFRLIASPFVYKSILNTMTYFLCDITFGAFNLLVGDIVFICSFMGSFVNLFINDYIG